MHHWENIGKMRSKSKGLRPSISSQKSSRKLMKNRFKIIMAKAFSKIVPIHNFKPSDIIGKLSQRALISQHFPNNGWKSRSDRFPLFSSIFGGILGKYWEETDDLSIFLLSKISSKSNPFRDP